MKKILVTIVKYVLAFSIAIFLLWWSLSGLTHQQVIEIKESLKRANYLLLIPVFGVLLLSNIFRALRWRQLITPMGYKPSPFYLTCGILIGYIGNQLIPRAGEVLRCTSISKPTKVPAEKLIGTIVAERAFDVVCLVILTTGVFYHEWAYISTYAQEIQAAIAQGIASRKGKGWYALGALLLVLIIYLVYRRYRTHKAGGFLLKVIKGLAMGLVSIKNVRNKLLFVLYTIAIWTCYSIATYVGCLALEETSHLSFFVALSMLVFGTFGIIVAPGGLGAYPIAIQKTLLLYGITTTIGLASGWILWIAQFSFTILFGTLSYIAIHLVKKKIDEEHISHPHQD